LDIELIGNSESRHTPAASDLSVVQIAIVLNEVASNVLFGERNFSVLSNFAIDREIANNVYTLALDGTSIDIHVVEVDISSLAVLLIPACPLFRDSGNLEAPHKASNMPSAI
jgi:aromatic ring-opening dioxygenase LigB subunit